MKHWTFLCLAVIAGLLVPARISLGQDTVKIGVLHSLSGTMAISETSLRDAVLMAVEEINANGGVLGKKIEPVVVDPAAACCFIRCSTRAKSKAPIFFTRGQAPTSSLSRRRNT